MSLEQPSFPHLKSLRIKTISHHYLALFQAMQDLRELKIVEYKSSPLNDQSVPPTVLGKLETISVQFDGISTFTTGRRVTSVISGDPQRSLIYDSTAVKFAMMGPKFGSNAMVTTVIWKTRDRPHLILDYLVENNPGVRHLTIHQTNSRSTRVREYLRRGLAVLTSSYSSHSLNSRSSCPSLHNYLNSVR